MIDRGAARGTLLALATLGTSLAKLTTNTYDDKLVEALGKLAMNDSAFNFMVDLLEIFTEPHEDVEQQLKLVAERHTS